MIEEFIKFLAIIAIPLFALGIAISLIIALLMGSYNPFVNAISELGVKPFTPFPQIFNYTFMVTSILFFFFFFTCGQIAYTNFEHKAGWVIFATILLLISSIGIFFIGFYNLDKDPVRHSIWAIITFACLGTGEFIMGILQSQTGGNKIHTIILVTVFTIIGISFAIFRSPILEWAFFGALIYWGIPLVVSIYRCLI